MIYVAVTSLVLLFLNIYTFRSSQELFYKEKEVTLVDKCQLAASEIKTLSILNTTTITSLLQRIGPLKVTRIIVADSSGFAIYDSVKTNSSIGRYVFLPEVVRAMDGNDVFSWDFNGGTMISRAAVPILSYGKLLGCVYMTEIDISQGAQIAALRRNTISITLILELAVILFSIFISKAFSRRVRQIMASMQIISEGDYSHKVQEHGNDELTILSREFNSLLGRLQESEETRRQFVSNASHELKTPLASIKLLSDSILQNDMDKDTVYEFVQDIGNEAERLNRMSQKLLSLSKIDVQVGANLEIIQAALTTERVLRMLSPLAAEHHIQLSAKLAPHCPILISEDDLYQIIFNLVENGIKYSTPNSVLSVTLQRDGDNAVLSVKDQGVGIPEDALANIFERFYRVDKARSRSTGGSGLGLSIVHELVTRNDGKISVESTVDKGSTFTVTFPLFDTEEEL